MHPGMRGLSTYVAVAYRLKDIRSVSGLFTWNSLWDANIILQKFPGSVQPILKEKKKALCSYLFEVCYDLLCDRSSNESDAVGFELFMGRKYRTWLTNRKKKYVKF